MSSSPLRLFGVRRESSYKSKISTALRDIDIQRRELENLRGRLGERRQRLFHATVRAIQEKRSSRASVYASEHAELRKVIRVVEASELALTQVSLRLQSITEIGDAMAHMNTAFRSLKHVSKTMEGMLPALDQASSNINSTFTEAMAQMGHLSPGINIDVRTEDSEELVDQAKRFAEEQAESLRQSLRVVPSKLEEEVSRSDDDIRILATGEDDEEDGEPSFLGTMYASPSESTVEGELLRYASAHNGVVDAVETSTTLGIPQDEVEHSVLRLLAEGKVRTKRSE